MAIQRYINRELSWLEFNSRVLDEANCDTNPVFERLKFLAITASNLDEFFMVRVGGLKLVSEAGKQGRDIGGMTAEQQLKAIRKAVHVLNREQSDCFRQLESELTQHGIKRLTSDMLTLSQTEYLSQFMDDEVVSVAAPIAIEADQHLPLLSGARLCLCVRIRLETGQAIAAEEVAERFAIIPLGRSLERLVPIPCEVLSEFHYMFLEDAIELHLEKLIGEQTVLECSVFRITRNADIRVNQDEAADLLQDMQQLLDDRTSSGCVRLEIAVGASSELRKFLKQALEISSREIYEIDGPLDFSALWDLASLPDFDHLREEKWPILESPDFPPDSNIFETIAEQDRILSHPYQVYDPVVQLVETASLDPDVIAIKQTLYRTSKNSKIVQALIRAAQNRKNVTAIVELQARFDEARNIAWAQELEKAGVDVIYGVRGLKTHAKICIVVRREPSGIKRYLHFGTGNYNESTAGLYSDISFFSDDELLGRDAVHFFNAITGLSIPQSMAKLAAAPINLREKLIELIELEIENARAGQFAEIVAKLNSLVDQQIIDSLYAASQAGVHVKLNVRGICCLRAGVEGLSENIEVISIIDRYLEHARVFYFNHGGDDLVFISSADWMNRNLDKRVELMVPIEERSCRKRMMKILRTYFEDTVKSRVLLSDNSYRMKDGTESRTRSQERLYQESLELLLTSTNPRTTVFTPLRGETKS